MAGERSTVTIDAVTNSGKVDPPPTNETYPKLSYDDAVSRHYNEFSKLMPLKTENLPQDMADFDPDQRPKRITNYVLLDGKLTPYHELESRMINGAHAYLKGGERVTVFGGGFNPVSTLDGDRSFLNDVYKAENP